MARSYRELRFGRRLNTCGSYLFGNSELSQGRNIRSDLLRSEEPQFQWHPTSRRARQRLTSGEFRHFLGQGTGSLLEAETQLAIALDLGFIDRPAYEALERSHTKC